MLMTFDLQKEEQNTKNVTILACRSLAENVFKGHASCSDYSENGHEMTLVKLIDLLFYKTVCSHLA